MILRDSATVPEDVCISEMLEQLDPYITALVSKKMQSIGSDIIRPGALTLEVDEIVQRVRIKLWHMLHQQHIQNPRAYISRIVHSELIDMIRRQKRVLPLFVDEEGELYLGTRIAILQGGAADPAIEVEQAETMETFTARVVVAVLALPSRQQQAILSLLAERASEVPQLVEALKKRQVDVIEREPENTENRLQLNASLCVARRKLRSLLMDTMQIEHSGAVEASIGQQGESLPSHREQLPILDLQDETVQEACIEAHIDRLDEPYRTAVHLHHIKKRTYMHIADELNVPIGTVKSHVSRGMKMLRTFEEREPGLHVKPEQGNWPRRDR